MLELQVIFTTKIKASVFMATAKAKKTTTKENTKTRIKKQLAKQQLVKNQVALKI